MKLWLADDFLSVFDDAKLVYFAGRPGTGKTLFGCFLALWLLEIGRVDAVISNVPLAFATPATDAPLERVALVIDELGWWFDARQFGGADSNKFRKTILSFPRKVQSYTIVCSKLVVDASFRALTVQRTWSMMGLWRYTWAENEGALGEVGNFWVTGVDRLFAADLLPPGITSTMGGRRPMVSQYYATGYIPNGVQYLADWCMRAVAVSQDAKEYDPNTLWRFDDDEVSHDVVVPAQAIQREEFTPPSESGLEMGYQSPASFPPAEREDREYLPPSVRSPAEKQHARKLLNLGAGRERSPNYSDLS